LENCLERAVALGDQQRIDLDDLPPSIARAEILEGAPEKISRFDLAASVDPTTDLEDIERATIERVFVQVNGDKALAQKKLGISRATLYRKLKRYSIGLREEAAQTLQ
jgi:transcriptional regulator of acetoin/glycerol metabolism